MTPRILAPHRVQTTKRMRREDTVLCVIDEARISYSTRPACEGLDVIGTNQTGLKIVETNWCISASQLTASPQCINSPL